MDFRYRRFYSPQQSMSNNYYLASFDDDGLLSGQEGYHFDSSYHVLDARLLGLSYADFLLYCVKKYNATLGGRNGYCYPMFKDITDCQKFCRVLDDEFKKFLVKSGLVQYLDELQ